MFLHQLRSLLGCRRAPRCVANGNAVRRVSYNHRSYAVWPTSCCWMDCARSDALFDEELAIGFIDPDAVCGDDVGAEKAMLFIY